MPATALPANPAGRRAAMAQLAQAQPEELLACSQTLALAAFHRAAARVPAYQTILRLAGLDPDRVRTPEDFQRLVPVTDKHTTFAAFSLPALCQDGSLAGMKSALTSSGHSGIFAFGINTAEDEANAAQAVDFGLQYLFQVDERRTLLINALPMGVKVPTVATTLVETSVREEMVIAAARKLSPYFEQTILLAEGSFAKKILEDGRAQGVDWAALHTGLITGEETTGENWRTYIASLLGRDADDEGRSPIYSSMGIAECGLSLFHETPETIHIRRLAHQDPHLRQLLFGADARTCPMLFIYSPLRTRVEILDRQTRGEILLTMLNPGLKIPLIRYKPGDIGRLYTRQEVADALRRCDHPHEPLPAWKLPLLAIYGRGQHVLAQGVKVFPEDIKEALYQDFSLAAAITGNFKLRNEDGGRAVVDLQLKPGVQPAPELVRRFENAAAAYIPAPLEPRFHAYAACPFGMTVDYERKFNYV